jgi:hypothetical protein
MCVCGCVCGKIIAVVIYHNIYYRLRMISRVCRTASRSNIAKFGASFSTAPSTSAEGAGSPAQKVPKFVDILDNKEAAKALSPEEKMKIGLYKAQKNRELTRRTRAHLICC